MSVRNFQDFCLRTSNCIAKRLALLRMLVAQVYHSALRWEPGARIPDVHPGVLRAQVPSASQRGVAVPRVQQS